MTIIETKKKKQNSDDFEQIAIDTKRIVKTIISPTSLTITFDRPVPSNNNNGSSELEIVLKARDTVPSIYKIYEQIHDNLF